VGYGLLTLVCDRRVGYTDLAMKYHKPALALSRKYENLETIGACLGSIGNCYVDLGQSPEAIDYYQ